METAGTKPSLVITPEDLAARDAQHESVPPGSPPVDAFPPREPAKNSLGAALWIVVPAVAAVTAAFGFLMCGGVMVLLVFGGRSDEMSEPEPYAAYSSSSYSVSPYDSSSDPYATQAPYVPTGYSYPTEGTYSAASGADPYASGGYAADPYSTPPTYVEPIYTEPAYSEPAYVEPTYSDAAVASDTTSYWDFGDPESDLVAAIERDEEELVGMDAAILAARVGEAAGDVESQNGETAADQIFGILFSVGADAVEQQLLAERAVVQARLDANRAELNRLRGN